MDDENKMARVLVLCTVEAGLDSIAEVLRKGFAIEGIVGLDPSMADPELISGFTDVSKFAAKWGIPHYYVQRYDLKSEEDQEKLTTLEFDLIWVAGWQRLIPNWLISRAPMGALGGHGSPDGILGGRGRSPQNWALMLGCQSFDLALFRITQGVDEGPVISQRSFFYNDVDDISVSYKKAALCMADMVAEVLASPEIINCAVPQSGDAFYYCQRKPEDGYVDWKLSQHEIWAHCRALTTPYPGLRTREGSAEVVLWDCIPFDDEVRSEAGLIDFVFEDGSFLVNCRDGRILVRNFSVTCNWEPLLNARFESHDLRSTLEAVTKRHSSKYPDAPIAQRILNLLND